MEWPLHLFTGNVASDLNELNVPVWVDNAGDHTFILFLGILYLWKSLLINYDYYFKESILAIEWKMYPLKSSLEFYNSL